MGSNVSHFKLGSGGGGSRDGVGGGGGKGAGGGGLSHLTLHTPE